MATGYALEPVVPAACGEREEALGDASDEAPKGSRADSTPGLATRVDSLFLDEGEEITASVSAPRDETSLPLRYLPWMEAVTANERFETPSATSSAYSRLPANVTDRALRSRAMDRTRPRTRKNVRVGS